MDLELKGKKALITGASRGIGSAIAKKLLDEESDVIIVSRGSEQLYITEKDLQSSYGDLRIYAEICDCTQPESLVSLKDRVKNRTGDLDIVIANIGDGVSSPDVLPDDFQWKKTWDKNFESALHTARTFLPMLQRTKGCLLFISSIAAMEVIGAPVAYSTAKTAVVSLAKNMARKLGNQVRVNVIAPGNIFFDGSSWDKKINSNPEKIQEIIKSNVPMNRFGTPEEIADAAAFLCSERATFITGSVLVIDGGQTVGIL